MENKKTEQKEINIGQKTISKNDNTKSSKKTIFIEIFVFALSLCLVFLLTYITSFNKTTELWKFRLFSILIYVAIILVSILSLLFTKRIDLLKISRKHLFMQILIGFILAFVFLIFIGIIPHLVFNENSSSSVFEINEFIYKAFFYVFFVAVGEELFFRCYLMNQLVVWLKRASFLAPLISGIIFGLFHLINGNFVQVIITSLLGVTFGYVKFYFKNCSNLSVILGHGLYDLGLYAIGFIGI